MLRFGGKSLKSLLVFTFSFCAILVIYEPNSIMSSRKKYDLAKSVIDEKYTEVNSSNTETIEAVFGGFVLDNKKVCKESTWIVAIIHSAVTHFEHRNVLRKYIPPEIGHVFLVGQQHDSKLNGAIKMEADQYGDMVIGGFYDSYHNLTLKHIMGLTWSVKNCPNVDFILKQDDDVFVNYHLLLNYIELNYPQSADPFVTRVNHKLIIGYVFSDFRVERNASSKWQLTRNEYANDTFPQFVSGWTYLTTVDTACDVLNQVVGYVTRVTKTLLWIDDVFVTGILRSMTKGIELVRVNEMFNVDLRTLLRWLDILPQRPMQWRYLVSNCENQVETMRQALAAIEECYRVKSTCKCCFPESDAIYHKTPVRTLTGKGSYVPVAL